ncbi:hypothetical protein MICRO8M_10109 [Microbacterium sp. 8M]|nr:hypothetical protein MICRO8M_10109 [Microbacterium sp. 8M]
MTVLRMSSASARTVAPQAHGSANDPEDGQERLRARTAVVDAAIRRAIVPRPRPARPVDTREARVRIVGTRADHGPAPRDAGRRGSPSASTLSGVPPAREQEG